MKRKTLMAMNLQLFGFSRPLLDADGGGGTNGGGSPEDAKDNPEGKEGDKGVDNSFDDLLKDKKHQSEFDKRIAKSLETAKAKWEADSKTKIEEAKTEAQKLAKMNADEKAKYEEDKRIKDLEKREKDINTRELKAQAYETLAGKGLPKDLVEILNYQDAETCNKSIEAVEKAFQSAVQKAVNEKLRGNGAPNTGGQKGETATTLVGALADYYK